MHRSSLYRQLAWTSIKNNRRFYAPYILSAAGIIMMFYIILFLATHPGLESSFGGSFLGEFLNFGSYVIGIFSLILLFYTNKFLMKQRKKELGLFHLLGMEKRHLARVQLIETLIVAAVSMVFGILCGILFSKLFLLLLGKLVQFQIPFGFSVSGAAITITASVFGGIFLLILINNLIGIGRAKPIELLRSSKEGEKEPKAKVWLTIIGIATLGSGYAIALLTESPLEAIFLFFVAVILVIIGTYCLFTSGSIALLKILRRNKRYYYQTNHFTSVSGILYRMKQNAIGLASICILSTMVLVMVSMTVSLYVGIEDVLQVRYPHQVLVSVNPASGVETKELAEDIDDIIAEHDLTATTLEYYDYFTFSAKLAEGGYDYERNVYAASYHDFAQLVFITQSEYQRLTGEKLMLEDYQAFAYASKEPRVEDFLLFENQLRIIERTDDYPIPQDFMARFMAIHGYVVNQATYEKIIRDQNAVSPDYRQNPIGEIFIDISGSEEEKEACFQAIYALTSQTVTLGDNEQTIAYTENREAESGEFYALFGGFLFIGIFLGLMFLLATILIIYYKQLSEGYEDKERFIIMQKVGMTEEEVKRSIRSQILTVFFLPLIAACVHIVFAFPIILKLLEVLNLINTPLFVWCTVITIAVFALVYIGVYLLTSRVYYQIVDFKVESQ